MDGASDLSNPLADATGSDVQAADGLSVDIQQLKVNPMNLGPVYLALAFSVSAAAAAESAPAPQNWASYYGDSQAWSYSPLDQIDVRNVDKLAPVWAFSSGANQDGLSATPLVIDGALYFATAQNAVNALDAASGHILWTYTNKQSEGRSGPRKPLGLAAGFGMIYLASADHHLIALDQKTGQRQ